MIGTPLTIIRIAYFTNQSIADAECMINGRAS